MGPRQRQDNSVEMNFSFYTSSHSLPIGEDSSSCLAWHLSLNHHLSFEPLLFSHCVCLCKVHTESWDQILILGGDILLLCTQCTCISVHLYHCCSAATAGAQGAWSEKHQEVIGSTFLPRRLAGNDCMKPKPLSFL